MKTILLLSLAAVALFATGPSCVSAFECDNITVLVELYVGNATILLPGDEDTLEVSFNVTYWDDIIPPLNVTINELIDNHVNRTEFNDPDYWDGVPEEVEFNATTCGRRMLFEDDEMNHRELLSVCPRCKKKRKWLKCVKNRCGKKNGRRLLLTNDLVSQQANHIRRLRGIPKEDILLAIDHARERELSSGTGQGQKVKDRCRNYVQREYERALVKNNANAKITERLKDHTNIETPTCEIIEPDGEDPGACKPEEHLGACKRLSNCRTYYADATECAVSEIEGLCMCGEEACACKHRDSVAEANRCKYTQFQGECKKNSQCGARGYTGVYNCNVDKGGVCYCGPGQPCGCFE